MEMGTLVGAFINSSRLKIDLSSLCGSSATGKKQNKTPSFSLFIRFFVTIAKLIGFMISLDLIES